MPNQFPLTDKNRLSITNPILAKEWNYKKNYPLTPYDVSCGSGKKAWWKCNKCGNEWIAEIRARNKKQLKCKHCNSLKIINPKLVKEWNYSKNIKTDPILVSPNSHNKVWWKCKKGHEWIASVEHRNRGENCPYCSGNLVHDGNSLSNRCPSLVKEWHPYKNGKLKPENVSYHSNRMVFWKCKKCGKTWKSVINNRTYGNGCPFCNIIKIKGGYVFHSKIEALFFLKYKSSGLNFKHNGEYSKDFGGHRYDFYFPKQNKYVEVTSYDRRFKGWFSYLRNIIKKKNYVENVLKANFEFIQYKMRSKDYLIVNKNIL